MGSKTERDGIKEKMREIKERFANNPDELSQYEYLMTLGMLRRSCGEIHFERYRIEGCRTAIWLKSDSDCSCVSYDADSDSLLVRGVLSLFDELYSGRNKKDAASCPPDFLNVISREVIYDEIRQNGLNSLYHQMLL